MKNFLVIYPDSEIAVQSFCLYLNKEHKGMSLKGLVWRMAVAFAVLTAVMMIYPTDIQVVKPSGNAGKYV
jgi:hypothetical protein